MENEIIVPSSTESESNEFAAIRNRKDFRAWLEKNHASALECWVVVKRGRPTDDNTFWYLDAVEEALCFGWIDSCARPWEGMQLQRFSPRRKNSPWTELNKERARRLLQLGLMTDAGKRVLPPMGARSFRIDEDLEAAMKKARVWSSFRSFPALYQRVRAYNVTFYKTRDPQMYQRALEHLITETKKGNMFGEWTDYGRLLSY